MAAIGPALGKGWEGAPARLDTVAPGEGAGTTSLIHSVPSEAGVSARMPMDDGGIHPMRRAGFIVRALGQSEPTSDRVLIMLFAATRGQSNDSQPGGADRPVVPGSDGRPRVSPERLVGQPLQPGGTFGSCRAPAPDLVPVALCRWGPAEGQRLSGEPGPRAVTDRLPGDRHFSVDCTGAATLIFDAPQCRGGQNLLTSPLSDHPHKF